MKNKLFLFLSIACIATLGLSSCSKVENIGPKIKSTELSSDNKTINVTFSEAVYSKADMTGALGNSALTVTAPAAVKFTFTITHVAGAMTATVNLTVISIVLGTEKFTVKPATATSIYDNEGKPMDITETIDTNVAAKDLGIIGKWHSEGANVAPILSTYFKAAKVDAVFNTNFTYTVNQFNIGNTTTTPDLVYTGTFVIQKSTTGNIWTITCSQETPFAATASGIFEIKTTPSELLWYEVAQTSGTQNVPPTPAAGFGSTNGGTLGVMNIQKFVRVP